MGSLQCLGESFVTGSEWLCYEPKSCGHWLLTYALQFIMSTCWEICEGISFLHVLTTEPNITFWIMS